METTNALGVNNKQKLLTFFSASGRATRTEIWIKMFLYAAINEVVCFIVFGEEYLDYLTSEDIFFDSTFLFENFGLWVLVFLICLPLSIDEILTQIRRMHDLNKSGWFVLFFFLGWIGEIASFIVCNCIGGTVGRNNYGNDPRGRGMNYQNRYEKVNQQTYQSRPRFNKINSSTIKESGSTTSVMDRFKKLEDLKAKNLITEEEYNKKREDIISKL